MLSRKQLKRVGDMPKAAPSIEDGFPVVGTQLKPVRTGSAPMALQSSTDGALVAANTSTRPRSHLSAFNPRQRATGEAPTNRHGIVLDGQSLSRSVRLRPPTPYRQAPAAHRQRTAI